MLSRGAKSSPFSGRKKLGLDFAGGFRPHGAMGDKIDADGDRHELVVQLCTRIGMMMEDLIPIALDVSLGGLEGRVRDLALGVETMTALANAAHALVDMTA